MKYGILFRAFVSKYNYKPTDTRCSKLSYRELKYMAKLMYWDVKNAVDGSPILNPLNGYMRFSNLVLKQRVYAALRLLFI